MTRNQRTTKLLLALVALLLLANLVQPLFQAAPVLAQDREEEIKQVALTGSGVTAWVLKGNRIYYVQFEKQFESIRIHGPEDLED
ncbi:MAG: hypothetical protein QGI83_18435 [Candidatus Latescibacteria bacterium]|jgi:hypothetical protein|nr:hypothetical protein [Candidatus Latescibacterota bacterium]